jgi:6-phospho-beta-glucosidase
VKLAVIGGGSLYTPELIRGWLGRRDDLPLDEIHLMDLPEAAGRLGTVADFSRRLIAQAGGGAHLATGNSLDLAIEGADIVINQFRVGGQLARDLDETVPLRHGLIGQETTGPGGFAMALRTIPVAVAVAERVRAMAGPKPWLINFTNPAGLVTEAILKAVPGVSVVGLCNIPLILRQQAATAFGVPLAEVTLETAGLNHLSLFRVQVAGRDVTEAILAGPLVAGEVVANLPSLDRTSAQVLAMSRWVRRLGWIPNPYFRYFLLPDETLADAQSAADRGENRARLVFALERELLDAYASAGPAVMPAQLSRRGGTLYSQAALDLIFALWSEPGQMTVNTPNHGAISDLPADAVVEMDVLVDRSGIHSLPHPDLPLAARGLIQSVKTYEQLTVEAALSGDREMALAALIAHPLVSGMGQAEPLLSDLLAAHRQFLPQFFPELAP